MKAYTRNIINTFRKISHWLWFGIVLSLIPISYSVWRLCGINGENIMDNIVKAISHGELMLICMSALAASIGEIAYKVTNWRTTKIWLTGATTMLALFTVLGYAEANLYYYHPHETELISIRHVTLTSFYIFWSTILLAISCLLLPEKGKEYVTTD